VQVALLKHTLRKPEILRGEKNFSFVFQNGKKIEGKLLRCFYCTEITGSEKITSLCRIVFAVSKNVKRAVDRNRMKRLLRESYRRNKEILWNAQKPITFPRMIVLLYSQRVKKSGELPTFRQTEDDVRDILQKLVREKTV
jgi:ribonuclease P protein component